MTPNPTSEARMEHAQRLRESWAEAAGAVTFRMLTDTNPDPWPIRWTHNDGRSYQEYIDQGHARFDACRDQDGNPFPLMPHQLHRQKASQ